MGRNLQLPWIWAAPFPSRKLCWFAPVKTLSLGICWCWDAIGTGLCQGLGAQPAALKAMLQVQEEYLCLTSSRQERWSCAFALLQTLSLQELQKDFESTSPTDTNNNQTAANGTSVSYITFRPPANHAGQVNTSSELGSTSSLRSSTCSVIPAPTVDPMTTAPPYVSFHTIILDMSGVCFVDLMGTKALGKVSSQDLYFLCSGGGDSYLPHWSL